MHQKINQVWQSYNRNLDEVKIDNIYEAINTAYLRRTISGEGNVAIAEIKLLRDKWNLEHASIVEIGGGYGAYCEAMCKSVQIKDYTIIDTRSMLRFAKAYLGSEEVLCMFLDTEKELPERKYDLLISNVCISEIPEDYAKNLLTKLFKQVKKVAIIDVELKWLEDLIKDNFDIISKSECPQANQLNHFLFTGEKI